MRLAVTIVLLSVSLPAQRADVRNSKDHPLLSRYPGSSIQEYNQVAFGQYPLALGVANNRPSKVEQIEGSVTKISYLNPPGRSPLEIYRNYEDALKNAGFETLWSCVAGACGQTMYWQALNGLTAGGAVGEIRYLTVRKTLNDKPVTVALAVGTTHTRVHIVEGKPLESGLVVVSAEQLAEGIERDGRIPVYAIYFDTGKSTLKPESNPALEQIAKLLRTNASLRLVVVGHTDNTGNIEMNMKLSADRAAAVTAELTRAFQIDGSRLRAHGVGPLAPAASNRSENGRAKNRRVELVEQ